LRAGCSLDTLRSNRTLNSLWTNRPRWTNRPGIAFIAFRSLVGDRDSLDRDIGLQNLDVDAGVLLERDAVIDPGEVNFERVTGGH
jgi:hypothetical protein